jgi:hypothetical protein
MGRFSTAFVKLAFLDSFDDVFLFFSLTED